MELYLAAEVPIDQVGTSTEGLGNSFCPECGQSLDLSRQASVPTRHRPLEPYAFAIFGLFIVVVFSNNAWQAQVTLAAINFQMEDSRTSVSVDAFSSVSDQERAVTRIVNGYLAERHTVQEKFAHDMVGVGFGVVVTTLGIGTLIQRRREELRPAFTTRHGLIVALLRRLWDLGTLATKPIVWTVLLILAVVTLGLIIRGDLPTLGLLERGLERTLDITIGVMNALP